MKLQNLNHKRTQKVLKTSAEWQHKYPEVKVTEPNGWNMNHFQYSWFEEMISFDEYSRRVFLSVTQKVDTKVN